MTVVMVERQHQWRLPEHNIPPRSCLLSTLCLYQGRTPGSQRGHLSEAGGAQRPWSQLPSTHHPAAVGGLTCPLQSPGCTYRSRRRAGRVGQGVPGAVHPPVDKVGSCAGDDGAAPDVHGDAHHAVGGDCGRGGACHGHLGAAWGLKVGRGAAGGVHLRLGVVGVGRPPGGERKGVVSMPRPRALSAWLSQPRTVNTAKFTPRVSESTWNPSSHNWSFTNRRCELHAGAPWGNGAGLHPTLVMGGLPRGKKMSSHPPIHPHPRPPTPTSTPTHTHRGSWAQVRARAVKLNTPDVSVLPSQMLSPLAIGSRMGAWGNGTRDSGLILQLPENLVLSTQKASCFFKCNCLIKRISKGFQEFV